MIHNHEVPSSILGRATREENPLPTARGFCFGPTQACLKEESKQITPGGEAPGVFISWAVLPTVPGSTSAAR